MKKQQVSTDESTAWKQAYSEFIQEKPSDMPDMAHYALLFIDDNSTHELLIKFGITAGGSWICTFNGSQVNSEWLWVYGLTS